MSIGPQLDPEGWVDEHGDVLLRYAVTRVGNLSVAEDLVQETFISALRSQDGFQGTSSERTWLVGILRHKIIDYIRKDSKTRTYGEIETLEAIGREYFDTTPGAHWTNAPRPWSADPGRSVARGEFWDVLQHCLGHLKAIHRRAFALRELEDTDLEEISNILGVSATNIRVILHRARLGLRDCLDKNWFEGSRSGGMA